MDSKINVVNIDQSEEEIKVLKLSETYWKDYLEEKNYNKDPNKMCELCIEEQIKKNGSQTIICSGLNSIYTRQPGFDTIAHNFSEEEIQELNSAYNAYDYMKTYLDYDKNVKSFQGRFYQRLILSCSARYKVVRMGRRCIPGYEAVLKADGKLEPIKSIQVGDEIVSYRDGKTVTNKVIDKWSNGIKPVHRVTLIDGRTVDCTANHPLLVENPDGTTVWKSIEDGLTTTDKVIVLKDYDKFGTYSNVDEAKLLGYLLADGYLSEKKNQTPKFTSCTEAYINEVQEIIKRKFGYDCTKIPDPLSRAVALYLTDGKRGTTNKVKSWLKETNALGRKYKNKNIMSFIEKFDKESFS